MISLARTYNSSLNTFRCIAEHPTPLVFRIQCLVHPNWAPDVLSLIPPENIDGVQHSVCQCDNLQFGDDDGWKDLERPTESRGYLSEIEETMVDSVPGGGSRGRSEESPSRTLSGQQWGLREKKQSSSDQTMGVISSRLCPVRG
jgi:hypothetical protein